MDLLENLSKEDAMDGYFTWLWPSDDRPSLDQRIHNYASRFTTAGSSGQVIGAAHAFEWIAYLLAQGRVQMEREIERGNDG
jgi:hypothetical protein